MKSDRRFRVFLPLVCLLFATACGGGGGSGAAPPTGTITPPPPPPPPPPGPVASSISLTSDAGDYIGAGQSYSYSKADAQITVSAQNASLQIGIDGDENWGGNFQLPDTYTQLEAGTYTNLTRYPGNDPSSGGLSWTGEGRGCNTITGTLTINEVVYDGSNLSIIDLEFEQHCEGNSPALRGAIYWDADDATSPPGPVLPPPAGLWQPSAGAVPATGNYVYLESRAGDYIGQGGAYLYTNSTAVISVNAGSARLSVSVDGDENWNADFQAMNVISFIEAGYYGDLRRYPFHNPVKGGLNWSGEGRGCNRLTGWFVVDNVTYNGNTLASIDLRFEQHCDGGPALNGAIHWDVNDNTGAPGPVVPPPAGLWAPAQGVTPVSGNYVYLESDLGDYIGAGQSYLYTPLDSVINVDAASAHLTVSIQGDESWNGEFQAMNSLMRLEVGYYGNLQRFPFHNPVTGGLSWSGEGRGCNTLTGWFVVDSVTYNGNTLMAIDLRFEQHCEGNGPALNGEIHWDANDTTSAPGPVVPPPTGLWSPTPGVTPASGNYVYLESQVGDWVGQGLNYLYTPLDTVFSVSTTGARLNVGVTGDESWNGNFQAMNSLSQLEVGYYGDLQRYPFHNPVKGGLNWSGEGRGCNRLTGWFVVDSITYSGSTLTAIDLRFQQHCDGGPALNGEIHWDASDTTAAPGPVLPIPAGLWEPTPGITPTNSNYVYLESDFGDWVGGGANYLYTPADSIISVNAANARLTVDVNGDEDWGGTFQAMNSISQLQVGYYGDLQRYPFHNPVKGGMSWSGEGRGCNTLTGWFVVDSITYSGSTLTAIDLRFQQHCDGGPALNGEIHWDASDTTTAPGPVVPIPSGLWTPTPGVTPTSGNFVYLESESGDYIGQGANYLYTDDSEITINAPGARLEVTIRGNENWSGSFQGMNSLNYLEVGYYGNLERFPFHNPVKGGLSWSGEGRGCNQLTGWFVVDSVTYVGVTLTAIDLRFEQHCEGGGPALNGVIHWSG